MNSRYSERLGRALGVRYSERALFTQTVQLFKCRTMSTNNNMQIKLYAFIDSTFTYGSNSSTSVRYNNISSHIK
jgi:hypothetical protein